MTEMDPQLKQRIVGAAVLFALAVIFLPPFLSQSTELPPALPQRDIAPLPTEPLPPPPLAVEAAVLAEVEAGLDANNAELAGLLDSEQAGDPVPPRAPAHDIAHAEVAPSLPASAGVTASHTKPRAAAGSWCLQLGSFITRENADKLRAKLQAAGFDATISPLTKGGKQSYRVRVGEPGARAEVDALHTQLTAKTGYAGILVRAEAP